MIHHVTQTSQAQTKIFGIGVIVLLVGMVTSALSTALVISTREVHSSSATQLLTDSQGNLLKTGLAKSTVEEVVRWTSPVNYMKRHLLEDAELNGVQLKAGDDLVMYYASANRDDSVFDRPFDFDIERHPNRHLGFGTGEHFCLGAHVARLSSRALFLELANRVEVMEPAAEPTHISSSFVCGLKTLPVRYKIRPAA